MITPTVVGLLAAMNEALTLDTDEAHGVISRWLAELDPVQARAAADGMAMVVWIIARDAGFDLEPWLRELGMRMAQDEVPT